MVFIFLAYFTLYNGLQFLFMFKIVNKNLQYLCKTLGTSWSQDVLFQFIYISLMQGRMK